MSDGVETIIIVTLVQYSKLLKPKVSRLASHSTFNSLVTIAKGHVAIMQIKIMRIAGH